MREHKYLPYKSAPNVLGCVHCKWTPEQVKRHEIDCSKTKYPDNHFLKIFITEETPKIREHKFLICKITGKPGCVHCNWSQRATLESTLSCVEPDNFYKDLYFPEEFTPKKILNIPPSIAIDPDRYKYLVHLEKQERFNKQQESHKRYYENSAKYVIGFQSTVEYVDRMQQNELNPSLWNIPPIRLYQPSRERYAFHKRYKFNLRENKDDKSSRNNSSFTTPKTRGKPSSY